MHAYLPYYPLSEVYPNLKISPSQKQKVFNVITLH